MFSKIWIMVASSESMVPEQKITEEDLQKWIAEIESDSALSAEFNAIRERMAGAASLDDVVVIAKDIPGFDYDLSIEAINGIAELFERKDTELEDKELSDNELEAVAGGVVPVAAIVGIAVFGWLFALATPLVTGVIQKEQETGDRRDRMQKMFFMATVETNLLAAAGKLTPEAVLNINMKAARGAETGYYK